MLATRSWQTNKMLSEFSVSFFFYLLVLLLSIHVYSLDACRLHREEKNRSFKGSSHETACLVDSSEQQHEPRTQ